jgi:hypothetical protein
MTVTPWRYFERASLTRSRDSIYRTERVRNVHDNHPLDLGDDSALDLFVEELPDQLQAQISVPVSSLSSIASTCSGSTASTLSTVWVPVPA